MPTNKNIDSPDKLYSYFNQYRLYRKGNPMKENLWSIRSDKEVAISKELPLTLNGFEIWLRTNGILAKLDDYAANKDGRYSEYADIIRAIKQEIYEDKFLGASVGLYSHNIIARDLGLVERKEIETTDSRLTEEERKQRIEELKNKLSNTK